MESSPKTIASITTQVAQDIIYILDQSGSMMSMGNEPEQSINSFIKEQCKVDGRSLFSLYTFNTNVSRVVVKQPLSEVKPVANLKPNGMTALYDAIGFAVSENKDKKNVICVILTDGYENSSREYKKSTIRDLTKKMEQDNGWTFMYLGANQDAYEVGGGLGVDGKFCSTFEATQESYRGISQSNASLVSNMRSACRS